MVQKGPTINAGGVFLLLNLFVIMSTQVCKNLYTYNKNTFMLDSEFT